jgi:hypothetical protein
VIEEGSEETVDTLQWSESDGEVTRRSLVELLNKTLSEMVREPLAYWRDGRYLFWKLGRGKRTRRYSYPSFEKNTWRDVVKAYTREGDDKPSYFRHDAFHANFVRIASEWYLAVEPRPTTYDNNATVKRKLAEFSTRRVQDEATRAWNFFCALYYKAGGILGAWSATSGNIRPRSWASASLKVSMGRRCRRARRSCSTSGAKA